MQKIHKFPKNDIGIIDLRNVKNSEKEANEVAEKEILTPFNLKDGPLIRLTLVRLEEKKYIILFNMHHVISDGWSMGILVQEFFSAYNSFRINKKPDPGACHGRHQVRKSLPLVQGRLHKDGDLRSLHPSRHRGNGVFDEMRIDLLEPRRRACRRSPNAGKKAARAETCEDRRMLATPTTPPLVRSVSCLESKLTGKRQQAFTAACGSQGPQAIRRGP